MTNEQFEKFKTAVLKEPLPEYVGTIEMYNPKTDCYCTAGLALRNLGYDLPKLLEESKTIDGSVYDPYEIFRSEFGLDGSTIGCSNDTYIAQSANKVFVDIEVNRNHDYKTYKKAPAKEIIERVLDWMTQFQEQLS